jgi:hypothetical protein
MARQLRPNKPEGRHASVAEHAERDRRRPRRADENGGEVFDQAQRDRGDEGARQAAEAAENADRENAADEFAADGRLQRLDDNNEGSGQCGAGARNTESDPLDANRRDRHQPKRERILRHRDDGASDEGLSQKQFERGQHENRAGERHRQSQWQCNVAEIPGRGDVGGVDVAEVDAEQHDQRHFRDEHQAEEKASPRMASSPRRSKK